MSRSLRTTNGRAAGTQAAPLLHLICLGASRDTGHRKRAASGGARARGELERRETNLRLGLATMGRIIRRPWLLLSCGARHASGALRWSVGGGLVRAVGPCTRTETLCTVHKPHGCIKCARRAPLVTFFGARSSGAHGRTWSRVKIQPI